MLVYVISIVGAVMLPSTSSSSPLALPLVHASLTCCDHPGDVAHATSTVGHDDDLNEYTRLLDRNDYSDFRVGGANSGMDKAADIQCLFRYSTHNCPIDDKLCGFFYS